MTLLPLSYKAFGLSEYVKSARKGWNQDRVLCRLQRLAGVLGYSDKLHLMPDSIGGKVYYSIILGDFGYFGVGFSITAFQHIFTANS